jgi:hypothetical protein
MARRRLIVRRRLVVRRDRSAASVVRLCLLAAALLCFLPAGCGDPGAGDVWPKPSAPSTSAVSAADELLLVQRTLDEALAALESGDLASWRGALPVGEHDPSEGSVSADVDPSDGDGPTPSAGPSLVLSPSPSVKASGGNASPSPSPSGGAVTDARLLREDLDAVFAHLAPLKLRAPHAVVRAVLGRPHFYSVRFTALIGLAGPPDRILAERILRVQVDQDAPPGLSGDSAVSSPVAGAVRIVADDTPPEVLRQDVMAFNRPRVIVRRGLVLVYENAWRARAAKLAPLADAARAHVSAKYGVDADRPAVVFLYASRDQVMLALAALPGQVDPRIKYFSHPAPRVADRLWSPTDVGVVAPALNGVEGWAPYMLQHEIAHAYTLGWFFDTAHAPDFLEEGLAVAAEESHDWMRLQDALAGDGLHPPLADAIALGDIWSGRETEDVRVLYSAGGSLVDFVLQRWGRGELRGWVRQVADSDLSRQAIADITKRRFGMSWPAFVADWRTYVEEL